MESQLEDITTIKKKDQIQATISLSSSEEGPTIHIKLLNSFNQSKFIMHINEEFIQTQDHYFKDNIESIVNLYQYLVVEFDKLTFSEDGSIQMGIDVLIKKQMQTRIYTLKGDRQKLTAIQKIKMEIETFKREMKDEASNQLRILKNLQSEQDRLYQQNQQRKQEIKELKDQINEMKKISNIIGQDSYERDEVQFNQAKPHNYQNRFVSFIDTSEEIIMRNDEFVHKFRQFEEMRKNMFDRLSLNLRNSHELSFSIKEQFKSLKITKIQNDGKFQNCIGNQPLKRDQVQIFKIKQTKTRNQCIMIGIGTLQASEQFCSFTNESTLFYYSQNGKIYENGNLNGRRGGEPVIDGSIISIRINMKDWSVKWFIDGIMSASAVITESMRSKQIYLFLIMSDKDDQIQLLY